MKHLISFPVVFVALCMALPATGFSGERHQDACSWHGHYYGRHGRFYGPWLPSLPFFAPWPYYGYYGPSVGVTITDEPAPTYRGARVDAPEDDLTTDVQRALRHEGYYHNEVDGEIGSGTRAAIRQYQYDHRLEVTGRIDRALLRSLGID